LPIFSFAKNEKMRLLIYGINYYPEVIGIGKYTAEMSEWLAERGHQVEVITAMPYYPEWKTHKDYKKRGWYTEIIKGVKVHRCPIYIPKNVNGKSRIIHDFSFLLSSALFWISCFFKSYDAVITIYPPLISGFFPTLYKIIRRKPMVFHIQDLQVDAAKELGIIKNKTLINILEKTEKIWLRYATFVSSISMGMRERILKKGVPAEKYFSLPNWVNTDIIKPQQKDVAYLKELGFRENDKIILYSGSMGEKQGLETILNIAGTFIERKDLFFVLAGEGMMKEKLLKEAIERNLCNVKFLKLQPYNKLPAFLNLADIHLILQRKVASDLMMPSKLTGILAAGGLSIVTTEEKSDLYKILNEANAAILIEPENETLLIRAIQKNIDGENIEIRSNARKFAIENISIDAVLLQMEKFLQNIV
jgi:colanic acid biosynthesis glycosyl transferase WcaI